MGVPVVIVPYLGDGTAEDTIINERRAGIPGGIGEADAGQHCPRSDGGCVGDDAAYAQAARPQKNRLGRAISSPVRLCSLMAHAAIGSVEAVVTTIRITGREMGTVNRS